MKILVVSQYYPPENTFIAPTVAREMAKLGHQVRVLTGHPNYPDGRIFPGYKQRWRARESEHGVELLRVPLWPDHSDNPILRMVNYMSFGLSSATARRFAADADVVYVYATQMTAAMGPWLWRLTGGAPYVLHVQDLWPDSVTGSSLVASKRLRAIVDRILTPWLTSVYRHASGIMGIAPTMVEILISRGVRRDKLHVVYNWAAEEHLSVNRQRRPSAKAGNEVNILYGGNVGDLQALDIAVRAAHQMRDEGVRLTIIGDGVALSRMRSLAGELGAKNIEFLGRVPRALMAAHYEQADFALVSLKDLPIFRGTIPSKLQAALAHGVPVICTVQGDARALVEQKSIGFTAQADDIGSLAEAFRAAAEVSDATLAEQSSRARAVYSELFSKSAAMAAIADILVQASYFPKRETLKRSRSGGY